MGEEQLQHGNVDYSYVVSLLADAAKIAPKNILGGRGLDRGVIVFNCPLCGDTKGRGWVNVLRGTAGCFRATCEGHGSLSAFRWARIMLRRGLMARDRMREFVAAVCRRPARLPASRKENKRPWVDISWLGELGTALELPSHWNITVEDALLFGIRAFRLGANVGLYMPVTTNLEPCYYTLRLRDGGRYINARKGTASHERGECLWGFDFVPYDAERIIVVESIADGVAVFMSGEICVAALGSWLSDTQISMLARKNPREIVVAFDNDATHVGAQVVRRIGRQIPNIPIYLGVWKGGKDASRGGALEVLR